MNASQLAAYVGWDQPYLMQFVEGELIPGDPEVRTLPTATLLPLQWWQEMIDAFAPAQPGARTNYAVHPGEFLAELMEERAITPAELSERTRWPVERIESFLVGQHTLTPSEAEELAQATAAPTRIREALGALYAADMARLGR